MTQDQHGGGQVVTFYSYKGGTGRTMAVANVAWILASAGHRVLVVDWDLESPGVHRFFHPFLKDPQLHTSDGVIDLIREYADVAAHQPDPRDLPAADVRRYAVSLDWRFAGGKGELDLLPAGRQGPAYSATVSTFDWPSFYDGLGGAAFLTALRDNMRELYDFVLIDSRTGLSDSAGICTVLLPDLVVNCFTLSTQSIDGAVTVARSIQNQRVDAPVRQLPVPMRVEDGEKGKLDAGRDYAWLRFAQFLDGFDIEAMTRYWAEMEIPYRVYYAYEEILSVFGDRPGQPTTLLAAYERLARRIAGAARLPDMAPMEESVRRFWLAKFERTRPRAMTRVLISHAAEDRMWAEWVSGVLNEVGLPTVLRETIAAAPESDPHIDLIAVLVSASYQIPAGSTGWLQGSASTGPRRPAVLPISLDGTNPPTELEGFGAIELSGMTAERARTALLTALNWPASDPRAGALGEPRFPGNPPAVQRLPLRNVSFTGRREVLAAIREQLSPRSDSTVPVAISGLGGVGKTQIATEYAHRFAADYDAVWWVPAAQSGIVRANLVDLADELHVPATDTTAERIRLLLDALRQGRPYARWLIIFDSARDPADLEGLIPDGSGHVLITSRSPAWPVPVQSIEIMPFSRKESIDLLRLRLPALSPAEADRIAERLGDLPLAIEQAGSWLAATRMPIERYLTLVDNQLSRMLAENPPAGYERAGAITWLLSLDQLRERSPGAARLVELLAFFGPEPVPASLLYSHDLIDFVAGEDPALRDDVAFGNLITEVRRFGLASFDEVEESLQMHRLVLAVIRESLPIEVADVYRRQVHHILVEAAPGDSDRPETWDRWDGLWPHVVTSDALHATVDATRQLILDVIRYLYRRSDFIGSAELGDAALRVWSSQWPVEDEKALIAKVFLANALRAAGDLNRSRDLSEEAYAGLMATVGPRNQYSIMSMAGLAADLWARGDFERTRALLEEALNNSIDLFGVEHRRTYRAMNNLAVHLERMGDYTVALRLHTSAYTGRRRTLSDRHPDSLFSAVSYGRTMRFSGDYRASRRLLESTLNGCRGLLGEDDPTTLRAAVELAATHRRLGELGIARDLVHDAFVANRPLDHPDRLNCLNTLAMTYSALGNQTEALRLQQECVDRHRDKFGAQNLFSLGAACNLAVVLRRAGEIDAARLTAEDTLSRLTAIIGPDYPYVLQCMIILANTRFAAGEPARALELELDAFARMERVLGTAHPERLVAGCNIAASRAALADTDGLEDFRSDLHALAVRSLGRDHPMTMAIAGFERWDCEIDLSQL
ncbi:FxSxx-COOH system tetratricopeptide repeat protein [Dactylosporangium sp. McL0621]|uniref:FxSxx-COOH system tetratricopeptide repeat protein n=1 Tax=Dactylosporangium sp. McL0621 TaxID=3415678 RepID=UPI003CEE8A05